VFRAIEMTADLLGKFYNKHLTDMYDGRNGELLQGFKANEKIFTETYNGIGSCDSLDKSPHMTSCMSAMDDLNLALELIRKTPTVQSRPEYKEIINHFNNALNKFGI
jgi:hypothetical protein